MASVGTRDEFKKETIRILQERAGNKCSANGCERLTSGPNLQPDKASRIGVAAHITAAAPGGPRYDPSLSSEERSSIRNGIWLCQNCARLIDVDPSRYTVLRLLGWKEDAERAALAELEGRGTPRTLPDEEPEEEGWICPHCRSHVKLQQTVCLGCHAEAINGPTQQERANAIQVGAIVGGGISYGTFILLPQWMSSTFDIKVPQYFGLGFNALGIAGGVAMVCGFVGLGLVERYWHKRPPRFIRRKLE